jgi:DNA-binding NarL/FixJ family response regulator
MGAPSAAERAIKVALCEDTAVSTDQWKRIESLSRADGGRAVEAFDHQARNAQEAMRLGRRLRLQADVVLIDLLLPLSGLAAPEHALEQRYGVWVAKALTAHYDQEDRERGPRPRPLLVLWTGNYAAASLNDAIAFCHPAVGGRWVMDKLIEDEASQLRQLRSIVTGEAPAWEPPAPARDVTPENRETLAFIEAGVSPADMADELFISRKAAEHRRSALMDRLDVHAGRLPAGPILERARELRIGWAPLAYTRPGLGPLEPR